MCGFWHFGQQLSGHDQSRNILFWDIPFSGWDDHGSMAKTAPRKSLFSPEYDAFLVLLRQTRMKAGMTQSDATRALRRPQSFISKCESGERRVDVVERLQFCREYKAEPAKLMRNFISRLAER
jgi:hypothetical protein